ncbi:MAG: type II secretion system protein, partial [uncultured bacterium]
MHDYKWSGINAIGQKITGEINANNKIIAKQLIENNDVMLLSLKKNDPPFSFHQSKKLSHKQRLDFTQQLHLLLQASIPLADALALIASTSQNKIIQTTSNSLKEKITQGISFATALADFPDYFDKTYCYIISAGEQSGQLEIVLAQLIENQEQTLQIKNKIAKALFYPISVLCIAIIIAIGLLIFVIPQFKSIYDNFGAQLPTMTRCLISMSHYLGQHGVFYFMVIAVLFMGIRKIISGNQRIKNRIDQLFFNFPLLKSLIITRQIAQWSQLLAMTLSAGIPLIDALHIANHAISQSILQAQMQQVRNAVIKG